MDPETSHPGGPGAGAATGAGGGRAAGGFDSPAVQTPVTAPRPAGEPDRSSGLLGSVRQKTTSQLNAQKDRASDQLDEIARNVRRSTRRLREERHDVVAVMLERAVDELERFSAGLRSRDMDALLGDLERFGRRQPALFIGSSFAAGLLLARFAKASDGDSGGSRHRGGRMSTSFNRPGPADAIGRESQ